MDERRKPVPIWVVRDADAAANDQVDAAYRSKYRLYAAGIVDGITNAQARSTTLKLVPRA